MSTSFCNVFLDKASEIGALAFASLIEGPIIKASYNIKKQHELKVDLNPVCCSAYE